MRRRAPAIGRFAACWIIRCSPGVCRESGIGERTEKVSAYNGRHGVSGLDPLRESQDATVSSEQGRVKTGLVKIRCGQSVLGMTNRVQWQVAHNF